MLKEAGGSQRFSAAVRDAHDAVTVHDLEGRILAWNPEAERMYGWSEGEALTMNILDMTPEGARKGLLSAVRQLSHAEVPKPLPMSRIGKDGGIVEVWLTAVPLADETGKVYAITTIERTRGKAGHGRGRKEETRDHG